jgi:tetratricopeptide (TPR) repeat protein
MVSTHRMGHYQPLTWLSYALDFEAAGLDAGAFHRTNVVLHAVCAVVVLLLAVELLRRAVPDAGGTRVVLAALAAACLFAVHPLRVESVAWVTERRDVLSGALLAAAVVEWLRWAPARPLALSRGASLAVTGLSLLAAGLFFASVELAAEREALAWHGIGAAGLALALLSLAGAAALVMRGAGNGAGYGAALALLLVSLLAKAWGIVLPALLLVLDAWPLRRFVTRRSLSALLVEKLPFLALAAVFAALARWAQSAQTGTMKTLAEHTLAERALQAAYGLAWYPWKTLAPRGLAPIYELPDRLSPVEARFLVPAAAVIAVTALLISLRRRLPALLAAWIAFGVTVSPVLGLFQSGPQLVADRYSYLACLPFALLAGGAWLAWMQRDARAPGLGGALAVLLVAASAGLTWRQTTVWRSDAALWEHAHALYPRSPVALYQLGAELERQGRTGEAREKLERGFALDDDPRFLAALARCSERDAAADPEGAAVHRAEAAELSRRALALALDTDRFVPEYRLNYGTSLWNAGQLEPALPHLQWFASAEPGSFQGRLQLGIALRFLGRPGDAAPHLEAATRLDPGSPDAWRQLAECREALADREGALDAWRRVLALAPRDPSAQDARARLGGEP